MTKQRQRKEKIKVWRWSSPKELSLTLSLGDTQPMSSNSFPKAKLPIIIYDMEDLVTI
jgi:hypothetical protein